MNKCYLISKIQIKQYITIKKLTTLKLSEGKTFAKDAAIDQVYQKFSVKDE